MLFQIHCESYTMEEENIVSVILRDTSGLVLGESYRFCLVLVHAKNIKRDLVVGCSNITRLQAIENADEMMSDSSKLQLQKLIANTRHNNRMYDESLGYDLPPEVATDYEDSGNHQFHASSPSTQSPQKVSSATSDRLDAHHVGHQSLDLYAQINRSFLPGLGLGILITSVFALIWVATKMRASQPTNQNVSTCYAAASTLHLPGGGELEREHRNRYLKLQATTSL